MGNIKYLNVDLEIKSRDNLFPIVEDFGEDVIIMHNNKAGNYYLAVLEIADGHCRSE